MSGESGPRRHHYVPAFYLGGFTDSGSADGKLWVHDLTRGSQYQTSPVNVGVERDFNLLETAQGDPHALEDAFGSSETKAAPIITAVCENREMPVGREFQDLMEFIALMAVRTPAARTTIYSSVADLDRMILNLLTETPERWDDVVSRMIEGGYIDSAPTGSFEDLRRFIESCEIKVHDNDWLKGMTLVGVEDILKTMLARSWTLLVSEDEEACFVVCDEPVSVAWTRDELIGGFYPPSFGLNDTRVYFPLSKSCFLMGEFDKPSITAVVGELTVAVLNSGTAVYAHRFLASPSKEFPWYEGNTVRHGLADHPLFRENDKDAT